MISTEVMRVSMKGNGVTKTFQFPFRLNKASDLLVQIWDGATLTTVTDYSIDIDSAAYPVTGGVIIYPESAEAIGEDKTIVISRNIAIIQDDSYERNDTLSVSNLEKTYDSNVQRIQQVKDLADRAIKLPIFSEAETTLPMPEANKGIYWDKTGTHLVNGMNPQEATDRAEESARRAETEKESAREYAEEAETAKATAIKYADETQSATTAAKGYAESAEKSEGHAMVYAEDAKKSETSALNSAVSAREAELRTDNIKSKVEEELAKLSNIYQYRGTVNTYYDLPTDAERGDVWQVATGRNYVWNGSGWYEVYQGVDASICATIESVAKTVVDVSIFDTQMMLIHKDATTDTKTLYEVATDKEITLIF